ncbi:hypothetical protein WMY93_030686 [Mugilogobius chulae]|uniref:C-type lectin domain-containing protein n=1 Tax=Mugilogobius chulae TaxID=88201 RepID=A0AAW0MGS1_9GOBI
MGLFRDSWTWSDGNSSSFRNWDVSENVLSDNWNPNTQQCARLSEQKRWKSENCNQKRPFICYGDPVKPEVTQKNVVKLVFHSDLDMTDPKNYKLIMDKIQEQIGQSGVKVTWKTPPTKKKKAKEKSDFDCPHRRV